MVDIIIIIIAVVSILMGFFRGFVREALSLVTWIVSIWLALRFYPQAAEYFKGVSFLKSELLRNIAGFAAVFIASILVFSIISSLLNKLTTKAGIKGADRMLGLIFGVIRTLLVVVAILIVGRSIDLNSYKFWQDSKLIPYFEPIVETVNDLLPQGLRVDDIGAKATELKEKGTQIGVSNAIEMSKGLIQNQEAEVQAKEPVN